MKITSQRIVIIALVAVIIYTIPYIFTHQMHDWTLFLTDYINEILMIILVAIFLISIKNRYYKILIGSTIILLIDVLYSLIRHDILNQAAFSSEAMISYLILPLIVFAIVIISIGVSESVRDSVKRRTLNTLFDQTNRAFYFEYNYKTKNVYIEFTDAFLDYYPTTEKMFNLPLEEAINFVHPEDRDEVSYFADKDYQAVSMESYYRAKFPGMKDYIWVYSKSLPSTGDILTSVEIDFSETQNLLNTMKKREQEIKYNEQDLEFIINHSNDFIIKYDKEGRLRYASESFLKFFDIDEQEVNGKSYIELDRLFQIEDDQWFDDALSKKTHTDLVKSEYNGKNYWISWHNHTVYNDQGDVEFLLAIGSNLTEIMQLNEQLDFDSKHDQLTKMLNRRGLYSYVSKLHQTSYTLFFIDIHHFMTVNDYYGSEIGDSVIVQIAKTLQNVDENLVVARYEGDEFILLAKESIDIPTVLKNLSSIQHKIYHHEHISIPIHLHIGYAKNTGNEGLSDVITKAAIAMTDSRKQNILKITEYKPAMGAQLKDKIAIIEKLKQSINDDQLDIYHQAIFDQQNNPVMIESLARWFDKDMGYVGPQAFFEVAKEASLIFDLDFYLITKSIKAYCEILKVVDQKDLICSINFTMETLFQEGIFGKIARYAETQGLTPSQICIEITESTLVENVAFLLRQVKVMKSYGFLIAIDDFGKEYSSLSLLKSLKVDYIKIDKIFTSDLKDKSNLAIIKMVIEIANIQNSKVIAEGIELSEQFEHLKEIGCDYFQGFHLERPKDYLKDKQKG